MNKYREKITEFKENIFRFKTAEDGIKLLKENVFTNTNINSNHIICELCSGAGNHIVELSKREIRNKNNGNTELDAASTIKFIGFELRYKRAYKTIEKARRCGMDNYVFVASCPAELINELFPTHSIDAVYINFPDPWEKKKYRKNRLLSQDFLDVLAMRIKHGGFFAFKTDHREYFEQVSGFLANNKRWQIIEQTTDLYKSQFIESNIKTEFEEMFLHDGCEINYLRAKTSSSKL